MQYLWFLLIGATTGWLAGQIMKGRGLGLIGNLVVGVVGSVLGGFVFSFLGLSAHGWIGTLLMATAGAVLLLFLVGFLKKL